MKHVGPNPSEHEFGGTHTEFETLAHRILQIVEKEELTALRKDFHSRLRISLHQPENAELFEDIWDFFYDWAFFEKNLPDDVSSLSTKDRELWKKIKTDCEHGLYTVQKVGKGVLKMKELYSGKSVVVPFEDNRNLGLKKNDIIEGRVFVNKEEKKPTYALVRRPSYHAESVHAYIRTKVKAFKKSKDFPSYQKWLWLLVGMYLKHRIYQQMPIEKIYDDNSRI